MLFIGILAFDQNVGNAKCTTVLTQRRLLSMANEHVTRKCDDLLPPDGSKIGVHVAWKVSQLAICGPGYVVHSSRTEHRSAMNANFCANSSVRRQFPKQSSVLGHCIGSLEEVEYPLQNLDNPMTMHAFMRNTKLTNMT
jgi:hypothetical protein